VVLGVIAHYVIEHGQLKHYVLAIKDIDSEQDGSYLTAVVLEVVND
jgi:hypothetical protein